MSNSDQSPLVLRSLVQIQQEYYENIPDCDWIKYELSNRKYLLTNIAFALYGCPSLGGDMFLPYDEEQASLQSYTSRQSLEGYCSRQTETVMKIYEKIDEQRKYSQNDEDIMLSVLFIVCARPESLPFYKMKPKTTGWIFTREMILKYGVCQFWKYENVFPPL